METYQPIPIRIGEDFQPRAAEGRKATTILTRLKQISEPLQDLNHPIWEEMGKLEHQVKILSLSRVSIKEVLLGIRKLRAEHLRLALVCLKYKLRSWFAGGG